MQKFLSKVPQVFPGPTKQSARLSFGVGLGMVVFSALSSGEFGVAALYAAALAFLWWLVGTTSVPDA